MSTLGGIDLRTAVRADLRFAMPVAVAWILLGILLGVPGSLPLAAGLAGLAAVTLLAVIPRGRALAPLALVCAACCAVLCSAAVGEAARSPELLMQAAESGRQLRVTAELTGTLADGQSRVTASMLTAEAGEDAVQRRLPLLVFGSLESGGAAIGSTVELQGTLTRAEPGDDAAFLLFATGSIRVVEQPKGAVGLAAGLRAGFLQLIEDLPGQGGGLLPGLAIGDTTAVTGELDSAMKASSLSHLTAVSGANCAVLVGLVLAVGGAMGASLRLRIAASVAVLVCFVVLVTPQPSVLRAAVMALIVLVARVGGRGAGGVPVLSAAVLLLLVIDPWMARSYGFVLSVFATAGLLVLSGPLARLLGRWLPSGLATIVAIPLAAQLACQPVLILLSPTIPVYGVVANILAEPAAPIATVLGLVACLLAPLWPWAALLVAQIAWLPSSWIAAVSLFFAGLPGASAPWVEGALGVALASVLIVLGLVTVLARRRRTRTTALGLVAVIVACCLSALAGDAVRARLAPPGDWQIAQCDIGQGDAVLLRSGGEFALIDTGPDPAALSGCLSTLGISRLALLVLTHFDLDHVGGVEAVVGSVDMVIHGPSSGAADDALLTRLEHEGAELRELTRGATGILGAHRWRVLWPARNLAPFEPGNDASVAIAIEGVGVCPGRCLSAVFLGDLGEASQTRMLAVARAEFAAASPVDVVKVAHHGSGDQSARLYEMLRARVGLIGVGAGNSYGHPKQSILDVLQRTATTVARSDTDGIVTLSADAGVGIRLWRQKTQEGARE